MTTLLGELASLAVSKNPHQIYSVSLPQELWERILSHCDSDVVFPFCHVIKPLKHVSEAIYNVGTIFNMSFDVLFPTFWLPVQFEVCKTVKLGKIPREPLPICSNQEFAAVEALIKVVSCCGGMVKLQAYSLVHFEAIRPILPKIVDVYISPPADGIYYDDYAGPDTYESILAAIHSFNIKIRKLDIPSLYNAQETEYLDNPWFLQLARHSKMLRCFRCDLLPLDILIDFKYLEQIELDSFELSEYSFDLFLTAARGHPRLRRVTFENMVMHDGGQLEFVRLDEELNDIGWRWYDGVGEIYGNPCVVWEKI
ncbi:hypothetical protein BDR26DRAFT_848674 [Obelidium mucronatum]|nr:hypothetical protein BDR26DRAFT_848674 [Obelidium mucronatum]